MERLRTYVVLAALIALVAHPLKGRGEYLQQDRTHLVAQDPEVLTLRSGSRPWLSDAGGGDPPVKQKFGLAEQITAVTRGRVQIEGGYIFTYDRGQGISAVQHAAPDMLLRIGLTQRLELRIGWPGYRSVDYGGDWDGLSYDETLDPNVGFLFDLWEQRGWIPQTAVTAAVPIAMEGNPLVFDSLQPVAQMLYIWELSDRWSMGGATGAAVFQNSGDRYLQLQQSVDIDYVLSDRLGTFIQWTMLTDHHSEDDGTQHLLSGGLTVLWTERFQSTLETGVGLNERAPDFLAGIRFSFWF